MESMARYQGACLNHRAQRMDLLSELQALIADDPMRLRVLHHVHDLRLPDCWVAAGFVRSAVWDRQHMRSGSPLPSDVDVIWFDRDRTSPEIDVQIETALHKVDSSVNWSVKNQARMHLRNGDHPYSSAVEAMKAWPETATAVAVRIREGGDIEAAAPFGLDDLFNLIVRPTDRFLLDKRQVYLDRLRSKDWLTTWPDLQISHGDNV